MSPPFFPRTTPFTQTHPPLQRIALSPPNKPKMAPSKNVDSAILRALNIQPDADSVVDATLTPHGGSGFGASSFKLSITTTSADDSNGDDGKRANQTTNYYFLKTGSGQSAETMFRGEHASLNAIYNAVPNFCPKAHAWGSLSSSPSKFFLLTDFLDLGGRSSSVSSGKSKSLAEKLAKLHTAPAPIPVGYDKPVFGFPVTTCCGATEQDNRFRESWAEFYAENRLRGVLREGIKQNGRDEELSDAVEKVASRVVPRLLGEKTLGKITPVVIHGDLWSGNHGRGVFLTRSHGEKEAGKEEWGREQGKLEEVVYDPSSVYGHSEYELGIMKMFGGFGGAFWKEYNALVKKAEPVDEWEDRVALYELYHHLNHFALFGGGYRSGAISIMRRLISKYGKV